MNYELVNADCRGSNNTTIIILIPRTIFTVLDEHRTAILIVTLQGTPIHWDMNIYYCVYNFI